MWYNDTSNALKFQYIPNTAGAWATGNNINVKRSKIGGTATGGVTTAMIMGGEIASPFGQSADTEIYNGTNWTEVNNLNTGRILSGGAGTQTAGLAMGGEPDSNACHSNLGMGTNWTEVNDLNSCKIMEWGLTQNVRFDPGATHSCTRHVAERNWTQVNV